METILRLRDIRQQYNGCTILDIPSLDIQHGSIVGLAGPNGSGKTTLLKILALAAKSTSGTVSFRGRPMAPFSSEGRLRITLLTQESYLLKRTVYGNIVYGLKVRGHKGDLTAAVHRALDLVGLHASFADRFWHELSGGETRRVALAARLVLQPDCLLLDEPTVGVDADSEERIRQAILTTRRDRETTVVIATHQRPWLNDICDRVIHLYKGRILDSGPENILLGPWIRLDNGLVVKKLADGQVIYASPPPHPDSSAFIAPEDLVLTDHDIQDDHQMLHGTVTGVFYERHAPGPRIHIVCGDQRFIAGTVKDMFHVDFCRPGAKAVLQYRPADITWLPD